MGSQIRQVLRTYYTRRDCWFWPGIWLVLHLQTLLSGAASKQFPLVISQPLLGDFFLGMIAGMQLKLQFANARARLVPGFAAAHLLVAGGIIALAAAAETVLMPVWMGGMSRLATAGLAFVMIVITAWCAYWTDGLTTFFNITLIMAVMLGSSTLARLIEDDALVVFLVTTCLGLAWLTAFGVRLVKLNAERPEYARQVPSSMWALVSRAGNRERRMLEAQAVARSRFFARLRDVGFRFVFRSNAVSEPAPRLLLGQLASGFPAVFVMLFEFLFVLALWIQAHILLHFMHTLEQARRPTGNMPAFSWWPLIMLWVFGFSVVSGFLGAVWLRRWPCLARELLYPQERGYFVGDIACDIACNTMAAATGFCTAFIVCAVYFPFQGQPESVVLRLLAVAGALYAITYGLMFWLVSFRSLWALLVGEIAAGVLSALLMCSALFTGDWFWSPVNIVLGVTVTAAITFGLHRLAFRRWCRIDLD